MGDLSNELHAITARLQLRIGEALESDARRKVSAYLFLSELNV